MKLATYVHDGSESYGLVVDDRGVVDVPQLWPEGPGSVLELLQAGGEALARLHGLAEELPAPLPMGSVSLRAPIPRPPKLIGLAVNYAEHHAECSRDSELPDEARLHTTPRPFLMPATAVAPPGAEVQWPAFSRQIDYEIELAAVIGSTARCVSPEQAAAHVAAYTIANDVSARSVTHKADRTERPKDGFFDWLHGKWADGFCPLGPWLVTADEVGDPQDLDLELCVNGEVRQQSNTRHMIFSVYELVSFISHIMTLEAGDVIATGTPSGVGMADGRFLQGGDAVTCRIERIGELAFTLGRPPAEFYAPCAR